MKKIFVLLLISSNSFYAQDTIILHSGKKKTVWISEIRVQTIAYKPKETSGEMHYIAKNDIGEIKFKNGNTEKITPEILSLDQAKENLKKLIDENALTEKAGRNFRASFDSENFLRMVSLGGSSNEPINDGLLFDLGHVYQFDPVSFRGDNRAYINIWTDRIRWAKRSGKERMDKIKMILRVNDYEKAVLLMDAFKQFHSRMNSI